MSGKPKPGFQGHRFGDERHAPRDQRRVRRRNINGRCDRPFHHTITKGFIMTTSQISMSLIVAFLTVPLDIAARLWVCNLNFSLQRYN